MTIEQHIRATALFDDAQTSNSGRLMELDRYIHGDEVTIHVAVWAHDKFGRLLIGENWHIAESDDNA